MRKLAERFAKIFAGLKRSSGRYVVPDGAVPNAEGKILGRAWSSKVPITLDLWEAHLTGKSATVRDEETDEPLTGAVGLGVVPIRDDSTAVFGAIDIDQYDPPVDYAVLIARIAKLKLPVIVCRSKSGAPHVYLFLSSPAPAELVRERLMEWSVAINHPGVEVFPKQTLLSTKSDGSWINVPYSGGNRSTRYALKADGTAMTVEEFVEAVDAAAISPDALRDFELPPDPIVDEFLLESPPCLQTLARVGFGDWGNNGLFNIAVYLKKRFGDGWESKLDEYNARYEGLRVGHKDVATITKSVKKKDYRYKCKDQPISAVCNRSVCLKREHGIGGSGDPGVVFGELTKIETDPVLWIWSIDGAEIECSTADLTDQRRFRMLVIERLSKWPNLVDPGDWAKLVKDRLSRNIVVKVPVDGTREGQFWAHLANFCTGRASARALDEILLGKAFTDARERRAYFRSTDFFAYLTAHRFAGLSERDGWRWLRHGGAEHHHKVLKGKFVNYWSVPSFPEQTEEHEVPRGQKVEM